MDEPPVKKCPHCGGRLKKAISAPAIQFKGTGWYVTDYAASRSEPDSAKSEKAEKAEGSQKSEKAEKPEKAEKASKPKEKKKPKTES
jgi:predicted nucleic acid-binding Zn ribbon protein